MIRPPSELRRKAIDSLITEASETKSKTATNSASSAPETASSSQESLELPARTEEKQRFQKAQFPDSEDEERGLQIADDEIQELPLDEEEMDEVEMPREAVASKRPRRERTELIQLRTGSIVKVKVLPGSFQEVLNKKCSHCNLILSSRVSMKVRQK